jgi:hypothetical protein
MGITAMPADGIEIYRMGAETCLVRLFKNPEITGQGETTMLTADVVEMQMKFDEGTYAKVLETFEVLFADAKNSEIALEKIKAKEIITNKIKNDIVQVMIDNATADYAALKTQADSLKGKLAAIDTAMSAEEIEAILNA